MFAGRFSTQGVDTAMVRLGAPPAYQTSVDGVPRTVNCFAQALTCPDDVTARRFGQSLMGALLLAKTIELPVVRASSQTPSRQEKRSPSALTTTTWLWTMEPSSQVIAAGEPSPSM